MSFHTFFFKVGSTTYWVVVRCIGVEIVKQVDRVYPVPGINTKQYIVSRANLGPIRAYVSL